MPSGHGTLGPQRFLRISTNIGDLMDGVDVSGGDGCGEGQHSFYSFALFSLFFLS